MIDGDNNFLKLQSNKSTYSSISKNSYRIKFRSDGFNSPVMTRMPLSQMDSKILISPRLEAAPRICAQMMEEIIDKVGNLLFRPLVV